MLRGNANYDFDDYVGVCGRIWQWMGCERGAGVDSPRRRLVG